MNKITAMAFGLVLSMLLVLIPFSIAQFEASTENSAITEIKSASSIGSNDNDASATSFAETKTTNRIESADAQSVSSSSSGRLHKKDSIVAQNGAHLATVPNSNGGSGGSRGECMGDMDLDGNITERDVRLFIPIYGETITSLNRQFWDNFVYRGDFDRNNIIDLQDLSDLLSRIGNNCGQ